MLPALFFKIPAVLTFTIREKAYANDLTYPPADGFVFRIDVDQLPGADVGQGRFAPGLNRVGMKGGDGFRVGRLRLTRGEG